MSANYLTRRVRSVLALVVVAGLAGAGCGTGEELPRTYPVKGRVVYKGGQPFPGGFIEFRSTVNPAFTSNGEILADGTFTLATLASRTRLPGAQEGPHTVTIIPRLDGDQTQHGNVRPILLPRPFTVQPDDSNDFTITLPGAPGTRKT